MFMLLHNYEGEGTLPFKETIAERKYDGTNIILVVENGKVVSAINRRGVDKLSFFPELKTIDLKGFTGKVLGEVVVLHDDKDDFNALLSRENTTNPLRREILQKKHPITFMAYDILTEASLKERKKLLYNLCREANNEFFQFVKFYLLSTDAELLAFKQFSVEQEWEGIILKDYNSRYVPKRSYSWLKWKNKDEVEGVIKRVEEDAYGKFKAFVRVPICSELVGVQVNNIGFQRKIRAGSTKILIEYLELTKNGRLRQPVCKMVF